MKIFFVYLFALCFVQFIFAFQLFERDSAPTEWRKIARAEEKERVKFRIALKQNNMDVLEVNIQYNCILREYW